MRWTSLAIGLSSKIPRALTAISALAGDVLSRSGSSLADTSVFAGELENMFLRRTPPCSRNTVSRSPSRSSSQESYNSTAQTGSMTFSPGLDK